MVPGFSKKVDPRKDLSRTTRVGTGTDTSAAINGHIAAAVAKPIRYFMMMMTKIKLLL